MVIRGVFMLVGEGLGVGDGVEIVEGFLALASELEVHHQGNLEVACCVLCVDEWVVVRKVHFTVKEHSGAEEKIGEILDHVGHILIDANTVRLAVDKFPVLSECR